MVTEDLAKIDEDMQDLLVERISLLKEVLDNMSKDKKLSAAQGELFSTFLTEVQGLKDYSRMLELANELKLLEESGAPEEEREFIEGKLNTHKLWFSKFIKEVRESYRGMEDRRARVDTSDDYKKISLTQIHLHMDNAKKLEYKDDMEQEEV